jgi:hypothetical protein
MRDEGQRTEANAPKLKPHHLKVLLAIEERLRGSDIQWAVAASAALALQGVAGVQPRDIDIQTDANGAYEIERQFAESSSRKVRHSAAERVQSHYGSLEIDGVEVEIMGDLQTREPDGDWSAPVDVHAHCTWIEVEGVPIPVMPLEHELEAYRRLGRIEKVALLERWLGRT